MNIEGLPLPRTEMLPNATSAGKGAVAGGKPYPLRGWSTGYLSTPLQGLF